MYVCKFWMNKDKFTRAGLEPYDLRIYMPVLYQLSNYIGGLPILSIYLFGGRQSEVIQLYITAL